jgi:hypothetical protein
MLHDFDTITHLTMPTEQYQPGEGTPIDVCSCQHLLSTLHRPTD